MQGKNKPGPSPYSGRELPSPRNVLANIASPFHVYEVVFLVGSMLFIAGVLLSHYTTTGYHNLSMYGLTFGVLSGVIVASFESTSGLQTRTPSINSVKNTTSYAKVASRSTILTIIAVSMTIFIMVITHVTDWFYIIDPSTRFAVTLVVGLSSLCSLLVVTAICSQSVISENKIVAEIVSISSLPEILSLIGFVAAPISVIIAGSIYNGPPIVDIPFSFTFVDSYLVLCMILILYTALTSRLG